jgi:hypothetical protein
MTFDAWFLGNADAIELANLLYDLAQQWDDVIDEGDVSKANSVLSFLAFRLNYLPFFAAHDYLLRPALLVSYLNWRDANVLEKGDEADKEKAFMLRAGIYDVFSLMAWIIGGEIHSQTVGPSIRRAYSERLADYMAEHT